MGLESYALLIPLVPLAAGLAIGLLRKQAEDKVFLTGTASQLLVFAVSVQALYFVSHQGPIRIPILESPHPNGLFQFSLLIDRLAAVMMVVISGIGTIIHLFSRRYMHQDPGFSRFYALLGLTTGVLLFMVASADLLMLFLFWQLLSWLLYLLLAYNYTDRPTIQVASKTFLLLRMGDTAFLAGLVLAYKVYGTLDLQKLFTQIAETSVVFSLWGGGPEISAPAAIGLLIFIGAMSKSAQFPMHAWLPDSMYTPTPVSALMHAGIVNAGGFLLNRLAPLYGASPSVLHIIFVVGALTAFLGASMMLAQNDIKKTLGYSTMAQMGYMIMECGLGAFALAIFHLIAHGLFKATLFLSSGSVIHLARKEPRQPVTSDTRAPGGEEEAQKFSPVSWLAGFITTLILPLIILLAAHGALSLPMMRDAQGVLIFLFFAWVTSSQAILTLYRLRAVTSWKLAVVMLLTLIVVVSTYILVSEAFTYFLYPSAGEVSAYFAAAALPAWLFDGIVAATALLITAGWVGLYAKGTGRRIPLPGLLVEGVERFMVRLYLFLINRLYLDAAATEFIRRGTVGIRRLNERRLLLAAGLLAALLPLATLAAHIGRLPATGTALLLFALLALPVFPFHGLYLAGLTRLPGFLPVVLALLLPIMGWFALPSLLPGLPPALSGSIGALALIGGLYGVLKMLVEFRVRSLIARGGLVFYSILWWQVTLMGGTSPSAGLHFWATALASSGLLTAWYTVQVRYGNLDMDRIGGLARTMPRFAFLLTLMVMAAVALPPFGLFLGFTGLLLQPAGILPPFELLLILAAWFGATWYLIRMMQRLLFGPPRADLIYEDLQGAEVAGLALFLAALVGLGVSGLVLEGLPSHGSLSTVLGTFFRGALLS